MALLLGAPAALLAPGAACSPTDVVVADLPGIAGNAGQGGEAGASGSGGPGGEAGRGGAAGGGCVASEECAPTGFCAREGCGAPAGRCEPLPLSCKQDEEPVCGCDGVSYWNDCLRRQSGVAASTPGQCVKSARKCGGPMGGACGDEGLSCGRLSYSDMPPCTMELPGTCWRLPDSCPPSPGNSAWAPCGPPPQMKTCVSGCEAIRSETPHRRHFGPHCP